MTKEKEAATAKATDADKKSHVFVCLTFSDPITGATAPTRLALFFRP